MAVSSGWLDSPGRIATAARPRSTASGPLASAIFRVREGCVAWKPSSAGSSQLTANSGGAATTSGVPASRGATDWVAIEITSKAWRSGTR